MLRISKLTDYATVILSFLALAPKRVANVNQIAREVSLNPPTVSKVLKLLAEAKLVISSRGTGGGYQLAKLASDISLAEIVAALEGQMAMTECCAFENACIIESLCALKDNWKMINKIILNALSTFTLQDMLQPLTTRNLKGIPIKVVN